jgi:hypothetical protein
MDNKIRREKERENHRRKRNGQVLRKDIEKPPYSAGPCKIQPFKEVLICAWQPCYLIPIVPGVRPAALRPSVSTGLPFEKYLPSFSQLMCQKIKKWISETPIKHWAF